jgi:hypothetical protein
MTKYFILDEDTLQFTEVFGSPVDTPMIPVNFSGFAGEIGYVPLDDDDEIFDDAHHSVLPGDPSATILTGRYFDVARRFERMPDIVVTDDSSAIDSKLLCVKRINGVEFNVARQSIVVKHNNLWSAGLCPSDRFAVDIK